MSDVERRELERSDAWLMAVLGGVFLLVFGLHVWQGARVGFLQPPVFAVPGDPYPVVGGLRLERGVAPQGLEVGDRLLRVGGIDLAGVGHVGFDALTLEAAGPEGRVTLVSTRDGVRHEREIEMLRSPVWWYRMPMALGFALLALLVLRRAPGRRSSRLFAVGFVGLALHVLPILGGPRWQTTAHFVVFLLSGPIGVAAILAWLRQFPEELPAHARLPWWIALWALVHPLTRFSYLLGGPIPTAWVPDLVLAADASYVLVPTFILVHNYRRVDAIGRRRIKWFLWAMLACSMVVLGVATAMATGLLAGGDRLPRISVALGMAGVLMPAGIWLSIVRYNAFDIDRVLSATAGYSLALLAAAGVTIALSSVASEAAAARLGVSATAANAGLLVVLLAVALVLAPRVGPQLDRVFFRHRVRVRRGVARLRERIAVAGSRPDLWSLVRREVPAVFEARRSALLLRRGARFEASGPGASSAEALDADEPLVDRLEDAGATLGGRGGGDVAVLLRPFGAEVAVPLPDADGLAGILLLGAKASGDIFTATDTDLLDGLSGSVTAALRRLHDADALAAETRRAEEIDALRREAEALSESRARLVAAVSHDLRQPVQALSYFLEDLDGRVHAPETLALSERMRRSVEVLDGMLDGLLDLSRIESGKADPALAPVDLDALLREAADAFAPAAARKGLALEVEPSGLWGRSDRMWLGRVVRNLVSNAVRYTRAGGVVLAVRADGAQVEIAVRDTGPGIAADHREAVFAEFVRLRSHASSEGLGLGLSIVARLCGLLGHELALDSEPGRGSTFRVRLARAEPPAARPATTPGPLEASLEGRLVLVVDDDLQVLDGARRVLRGWGCRVLVATGLDDALEGLEARGAAPDAVLSDYHLGEERGIELVGALRARFGEGLPAAIVSADTSADLAHRVRQAGLLYAPKPLTPARLRALLQEMLVARGG